MLSQIGSLIEPPAFYEHLSARNNLKIHLDYMGVQGFGVDKALQMVGLSDIGEKAVAKFSLGMRQRLGIARALIHQPKILILDEPINGLDPMGIKELRELFLQLVKENSMTILLSSHILSEMEHIADKIGVIVDGRIVCESDLEQIKSEYQGSLVVVNAIGLLAMRIGFNKKSVTVTLISSFILTGIYGNIAIGGVGNTDFTLPIIGISFFAILIVLITLSHKIEHLEAE